MALTTQQKLDDAEAKYHALLTGTSVRVIVDRNGERVEFTAANRGALAAYIVELKLALGILSPAAPNNGPASFIF